MQPELPASQISKEGQHRALNLHLVTADWISRLRNEKLHQLERHMAAVQQQLTEVQTKRAAREAGLTGELDETASSLRQSTQSHAETMQKLLLLQRGRLAAVHTRFVANIDRVLEHFTREKEALLTSHQALTKPITLLFEAARLEHEQKLQDMAQQHASHKRDLERGVDESIGVMKLLAEERSELMKQQIHDMTKEFEAATADLYSRHQDLVTQEAMVHKALVVRRSRVHRYQNQIVDNSRGIAAANAAYRKEATELKTHKSALLQQLTKLQREFAGEQRRGDAKMKGMLRGHASVEKCLYEKLCDVDKLIPVATLADGE